MGRHTVIQRVSREANGMARSCHRLRAVTVTGSGHTVQALPIDRTVEILKKYGAITTRAK